MANTEPNCVLLRRIWAGAWDAARFTAAGRPLRRPAFALEACSAQLDLAAQAVVRLRRAVGCRAEVLDVLPVEGHSLVQLELALEGYEANLPSPVADPAGFVHALVRAAFQTGDGGYGLGISSEAALDDLIDQHCEDLQEAARRLSDPSVAARDLQLAAGELAGAAQCLLAADLGRMEPPRALALSGRAGRLACEVRQLAAQIREAAALGQPARRSELDEKAAADVSAADRAEDDFPASPGSGSEEEPPAPATPRGAGAAASDEDEGATPARGESRKRGPLHRTTSQVIKRIKVEEVAEAVEAHRAPVQQLRRVLSQLDLPQALTPETCTKAKRLDRAVDELHQVEKLQKTFNDFGEDLMDGMLALDQLTGMAEADRKARRDTILGIQGLLQEIDTAKPRMARMQRKLAAQVEELGSSGAAAADPGDERAGMGAAPGPPPQPSIDWGRLRLPVRFSSLERPDAYVLAASAPGLEPDSLRLARGPDNTLRVQGLRVPSPAAEQALLAALAELVSSLPKKQQRRLTVEDAEALLLRLGHGRYGRFSQDFKLPRDANWGAVDPSYKDGVLRIVLPRDASAGQADPERRSPQGSLGAAGPGSGLDLRTDGLVW